MTDIAALDSLRIVLDPLGQAGVAVALMLVMFSVALGLKWTDFVALAETPRVFLGGVLSQVVLLPLVTFILIHCIEPPPSIALGMIVVACCPGGAVSNLLTYLSRGALAVSVALTATSSLLAALLTPTLIVFWSRAYSPTAALFESLDVSPLLFVGQTTLLLALPLVIGMWVAVRWPEGAAKLRKRASVAGSAVLGATIVYGIVYFYPVLWPAVGLLAGVTVLHNTAAFATGALVARVLSERTDVRRAVTFEFGIQNSGLALIILLSQLQGVGGAAAIAAVWGVWHLIAGSLLALMFNYSDRKRVAVVLD